MATAGSAGRRADLLSDRREDPEEFAATIERSYPRPPKVSIVVWRYRCGPHHRFETIEGRLAAAAR
jgi:hypothetical protein